MKHILLSILTLTFFSCASNSIKIDLGPHESKLLVVDPSEQKMMSNSEYEIVDVVPLDLPKEVSAIIPKDIQIVNDRIYILDSDANKTIFMFGKDGSFIGQLGRVGHAKNEYIKKPESLSIDEKSGIAYVYERSSSRIMKFDSIGNFIGNERFDNFFPGSVAETENGNYLCCFDRGDTPNKDEEYGPQLSLFDKNGNLIKAYLSLQSKNTLSLIGKPVYKDKERISVVPYLADSVVVFSGDELDYTMKIDFCGQFVPQEIRDKSIEEGSYSPLYDYKGVQFIDQFEITDSIIHVGYAYNLSRSHFVQNRANGKSYNTTVGPLFSGYSPVCDFFVAEDKLLYYIEEMDVDKLLAYNNKGNDSPEVKLYRKSSKQTMLNIMDKKFNFPLIMMVKLK